MKKEKDRDFSNFNLGFWPTHYSQRNQIRLWREIFSNFAVSFSSFIYISWSYCLPLPLSPKIKTKTNIHMILVRNGGYRVFYWWIWCTPCLFYFCVICTGETLHVCHGFAEGKNLVVSVISAMGAEHICALKDIGLSSFYWLY